METISVSSRLKTLPISSVRKLIPYAQEAKKAGVTVYHLNIGDPDLETPSMMLDALKNFSENPIRYADSKGELSLRKALTQYYTNLGFSFVTADHIIVTVGGSEGCVYAFFATCSPGDEILVFEPYYSNYATCAAFAGVTLKTIPTAAETGYHLPNQRIIEQAITPKTKAILYCSPGNPTGTVYTKEEMRMLVDIAKKHNLFLIADEVYREFVYEGIHTSLLSFIRELPEQTILLDSLSKRYNLCGARIGIFLCFNQKLMKGINKLTQSRLSAGLVDQAIAAKLTDVPKQWMDEMIEEYKKRRDVIYDGLSKIPGIELAKPEGAFYCMVTLPVDDAEKFAIFLLKDFRLNNETVMLAPGNGFYQHTEKGKQQVRIAYVLNTKALKTCITIIKAGLSAYKNTTR